MLGDRPEWRRGLLLLGVLLELGLGLVALVLGRLIGIPVEDSVTWRSDALAIGFWVALPMLATFWLLLRYENTRPLAEIRRVLDAALMPLLRGSSLVERIVLCASAGLGEELLFRGLIQNALTTSLGQATGLVLASLAFGLAHPITRTYVALATVYGMYLGWAWIASGNLLVVIVAHGSYDLVAIEWLLRQGPRIEDGDRGRHGADGDETG
jgi:membrane protease YdiL (CAAX protease family)